LRLSNQHWKLSERTASSMRSTTAWPREAETSIVPKPCGLLLWRDLIELPLCVEAPLLKLHTRFLKWAPYCETIEAQTSGRRVAQQGLLVQHHRVLRGDDLICEAPRDAHAVPKLQDGALKALVVPEFIRLQHLNPADPPQARRGEPGATDSRRMI
jgi:hypothetical protein